MIERRFQLMKLAKGDYLLPSNDADTLWRITLYTGSGEADDPDGWAIYRYYKDLTNNPPLDTDDWEKWHWDGWCRTRAEAIQYALERRT